MISTPAIDAKLAPSPAAVLVEDHAAFYSRRKGGGRGGGRSGGRGGGRCRGRGNSTSSTQCLWAAVVSSLLVCAHLPSLNTTSGTQPVSCALEGNPASLQEPARPTGVGQDEKGGKAWGIGILPAFTMCGFLEKAKISTQSASLRIFQIAQQQNSDCIDEDRDDCLKRMTCAVTLPSAVLL
jgi:hypothetical protein